MNPSPPQTKLGGDAPAASQPRVNPVKYRQLSEDILSRRGVLSRSQMFAVDVCRHLQRPVATVISHL